MRRHSLTHNLTAPLEFDVASASVSQTAPLVPLHRLQNSPSSHVTTSMSYPRAKAFDGATDTMDMDEPVDLNDEATMNIKRSSEQYMSESREIFGDVSGSNDKSNRGKSVDEFSSSSRSPLSYDDQEDEEDINVEYDIDPEVKLSRDISPTALEQVHMSFGAYESATEFETFPEVSQIRRE